MGEARRSSGGRGSRASAHALAALAASAVLFLGLVGAGRSRQLTLERRATADLAVLGVVATGVAVDLERGLEVVESSAAGLARTGPAGATGPRLVGSIPGAQELGFLPLDPAAAAEGSPIEAGDRADPLIAALLDRTRDTGEAVPSAAIELRGERRTLLIAPAYADGPIPGPPRTAPERRARVLGWVVASVDPAAVAERHLADGAVASVVSDGVEVGTDATAPLPSRLPSQRIEVRGRGMTVSAGDPTGVPFAEPTILLVIAGALGGAAAAAAVIAGSRRLRRQHAEITRSADQVRLVGEVAPLVQQSLELGEVLPAVAVQLTDHFGLAGVRLSTGSSSSKQLELFSFGERSRQATKPVLRPPDHVAAGESLTLALQRGGRSVALLELVAGRDLDDSDLRSLHAITELVTAAVVNASLYASQQAAVLRLRDLDALKTVFLSTASHELRTPATAIGGFASLLTNSWDRFSDEQRRDFAGRIAANATSLGAVVQDLLDFSLLDRGGVDLLLVEVDLGGLAEGVVARLEPMFSDHVISCTVQPAPLVMGEVNGLERIVTNLLTNAVKFSPVGSTVVVAVEPQDGGAAIVVCDQGPGVPPEERQSVFTRFYRGSGEAVLQTRGVGIGLSVVAELVARMGGVITLDDAPGGGARFSVRLVAPPTPLTDKEAEDATTR